eukprot:8595089-Pyramimonas_sp.AAC.1
MESSVIASSGARPKRPRGNCTNKKGAEKRKNGEIKVRRPTNTRASRENQTQRPVAMESVAAQHSAAQCGTVRHRAAQQCGT